MFNKFVVLIPQIITLFALLIFSPGTILNGINNISAILKSLFELFIKFCFSIKFKLFFNDNNFLYQLFVKYWIANLSIKIIIINNKR